MNSPDSTDASTNVTKTSFLIDKYTIKTTQPPNKKITKATYNRYNKKTKVYTSGNRFLKIGLFQSYPWATSHKGSLETGPGLLKCGICCLGKEKGWQIWYGGNKTSEDVWVTGSDCWVNMNKEEIWMKHEDSVVILMQ